MHCWRVKFEFIAISLDSPFWAEDFLLSHERTPAKYSHPNNFHPDAGIEQFLSKCSEPSPDLPLFLSCLLEQSANPKLFEI